MVPTMHDAAVAVPPLCEHTFSGSGLFCSPGLTSEIPRVCCRKRTDASSRFRLSTLDSISSLDRLRKSAACAWEAPATRDLA